MKRAETVEERRQQWKDRYFNLHSNDETRKIILQQQNKMLREYLKK
nr:hypothetical protein [uncultured Lachnoclostridium sp.]